MGRRAEFIDIRPLPYINGHLPVTLRPFSFTVATPSYSVLFPHLGYITGVYRLVAIMSRYNQGLGF